VIVEPSWHEARGAWYAKCLCDCGKETTVRYEKLANKHTQSCGCLSVETATTHGKTNTEEYKIWANILYRCQTETAPNYANYGGRGITVCGRWQEFENFLEDMGVRPYPKASVDRIDVNGNYEPENCKWSSIREQASNKRNTHYVKYNEEEIALPVLCRQKNADLELTRSRINNGWTLEEAFTIPAGGRRKVL